MTTEDRMRSIVSRHLGVDDVQRDHNLMSDLGADSLDVMELSMDFEDEFKITIPDSAFDHVHTFGQAVEYIESRL